MPESWPPDASDGRRCGRCETHVSRSYYRTFSDPDGVLRGCRHCLPRSVRFGNDHDRDADDIEFSLE